jgi:hypothetical protein
MYFNPMNCALVMGAAVLNASNTDALRRGGRAFRNTQVCLQGRDMSLTFTCIRRKSGICKRPVADIGGDIMTLAPVSLEIP